MIKLTHNNSHKCLKKPVKELREMIFEERWLFTTSEFTINTKIFGLQKYWPLKALGCLLEVTTKIGFSV